MPGRFATSILPFAVWMAGCSNPSERSENVVPWDGGSPSGETDDDEVGTSGAPGSDDDAAESTGSLDVDWVPARGIAITNVEANQGVASVVGQSVPPELVTGRATLIRAAWDLAEPGTPKTVEARLSLRTRDGAEHELFDTRTVQGPGSLEQRDTSFEWLVPPERMTPGVQYSIALFEASPGDAGDPSPSFPPSGFGDLGVLDRPMALQVVMIPLVTPGGGFTATADFKAFAEERLLASFPVRQVEVTWHDPWVRNTILTDEQQAWDILAAARAQDAPNTAYYHLLLDPNTCCDESAGQFLWGGVADLVDEQMIAEGWYGDAMTMMDKYDGVTWIDGMEVLVHELGHNHGREHAPCGDPYGPDPAYPYPGAEIAHRGYDIVSDDLIVPLEVDDWWGEAYTDFMGYCARQWWSDYSWAALRNRVALRSSSAAMLDAPLGWELRVYIRPGFEAQWRWMPSRGPSTALHDGGSAVEIADDRGEPLAKVGARVTHVDHGDLTVVRARVPSIEGATHVTLSLDGQRLTASSADWRVLGR